MFARRQMLHRVASRAAPLSQGNCCCRRDALVSCLKVPTRASAPVRWQPIRLLSAAQAPEPELDNKGGQNMRSGPGGSSSVSSAQKIHVERKLMPAGIISRGFAVLLDGVLAGGASAVVCELALAYGYTDGLGAFVASFGALMLVRDQLPGQFASVGKQRLGLELVGSDPSTNGEKYGRPLELVLIQPMTVGPVDVPVSVFTRLARNAHWSLLVPLGLSNAVPMYTLIPSVVAGGIAVELLLVLTTRRSIGDFVSGTSLVWHDQLGSQKKALAKADASGGRLERAQEAWEKKQKEQKRAKQYQEALARMGTNSN